MLAACVCWSIRIRGGSVISIGRRFSWWSVGTKGLASVPTSEVRSSVWTFWSERSLIRVWIDLVERNFGSGWISSLLRIPELISSYLSPT